MREKSTIWDTREVGIILAQNERAGDHLIRSPRAFGCLGLGCQTLPWIRPWAVHQHWDKATNQRCDKLGRPYTAGHAFPTFHWPRDVWHATRLFLMSPILTIHSWTGETPSVAILSIFIYMFLLFACFPSFKSTLPTCCQVSFLSCEVCIGDFLYMKKKPGRLVMQIESLEIGQEVN